MLNRLITLALAGALSLGLLSAASASQGTGCMPTVGIVSGLAFSLNVNAAIASVISSNSGPTAPATDCSAGPIKGQVWLDTSAIPNIWRMYDGVSAWLPIGALDNSSHVWTPPVGGGTASVTAAATTDLCASPSAVQNVLGTTSITSFGSACVVGIRKTLIFAAATPLIYNAVSLILPGQFTYTTNPGDVADAIYLGAGNWRIVSITKIDGSSVVNPAFPLATVLYGDYATIPGKTVYGAGQALSRASYPQYLAAVTRAQNATLTAGNTTITSVPNTAGLGAGMPLEGTGVQPNTTIVSVTPSTIVMSLPATANGVQTVTAFITGYGSGGNNTTVGVKDCQARVMAGRDGTLGTVTNRMTTSYFGANAAAIGAVGGGESFQMGLINLVYHTHSGQTNFMDRNQSHSHGVTGGIYGGALSSLSDGANRGTPIATTLITISATNTDHQHSFTTNGGDSVPGSPTPMRTVQPTVTAECVVVVQP